MDKGDTPGGGVSGPHAGVPGVVSIENVDSNGGLEGAHGHGHAGGEHHTDSGSGGYGGDGGPGGSGGSDGGDSGAGDFGGDWSL